MSDDLIKRDIVIATIGRMYEVCTTRDITDYRDLMLEAVKVLPSADRPTVIRVKSLMGKEDYERLADSIRQQAPTAIVIPPYAELVTPADRPQGEWIDEADKYDASFGIHDYRCSNCNSYADEYIGGHEWYTAGKPNFCPHCGADMREREGEWRWNTKNMRGA